MSRTPAASDVTAHGGKRTKTQECGKHSVEPEGGAGAALARDERGVMGGPWAKWHGYINGRPDLDETALIEEAVRRKMEQLRERIETCGASTERQRAEGERARRGEGETCSVATS